MKCFMGLRMDDVIITNSEQVFHNTVREYIVSILYIYKYIKNNTFIIIPNIYSEYNIFY